MEDVIRDGAVVPVLWRLEIANSLRSALRRGRITREFRDGALSDLANLSIAIDAETNRHAWASLITLSDWHELTPYDAAYLELAHRQHKPLATLDKRLGQAALSMGVEVRGVES